MQKLDALIGEILGNIQITVYKTPDGYNFFEIRANNEDVLPVLDIIQDTLFKY